MNAAYELTHAVLRYASACARTGDWSALRDMGFSEAEVDALHGLSLGELAALERGIAGHVLRVELDRPAFWLVVEQVRRQSRDETMKLELIRRDAPAEMMERLFGMGMKEYSACRRRLRAPRGVGRPPEPDEATARDVWLAWKQLQKGRRNAHLDPAGWIALQDQTGASLRVVWRLVGRWMAEVENAA